MMAATSKPLAALSSALLARKGQARPAMRRQATLAEAGDALGWNDMGEPAPLIEGEPMPVAEAAPPAEPQVLVEREALAQAVSQAPALTPSKGRKAFTLRLDADRHARLRGAVAAQGRSAQQLVTEALDMLLANLPADASPSRDRAARSGETR